MIKKCSCFKFVLILTLFVIRGYAQKEAVPPATSAAKRLEGFEQRKRLEQNSLVSNLKFRSAGPTIMSGRVVDVDVSPDDPTHFYVAYASGGLWVTYNNGQSFEPVFDHETVMTIGDIAVDWKHGEIIWVGTGENNSSRSSYSGVGMFKSVDQGKTWEYKGLGESHHIGRIILNPDDANTIFVAALGHLYSANDERGVYKTKDGGTTWKKTLFIDKNTGAIDLAINPADPKILYAAMWHRERRAWNLTESGETSGIYKSTDAGESWHFITGKESGFPNGPGTGRIGISVYQKNPDIIYAILDNQSRREKKKEEKKNELTKDTLRTISKENFLLLNDTLLSKFLKDHDFDDEYTAKRVKEMVKTDSIKPVSLVEYLEDANTQLFDTEVKGAEVYLSEDAGKTWKRTHDDYLDRVFNSYGYYFGQIRISPFDYKKIFIVGVPVLKSEDGGKTFKSIDASNTHGDYHALWLSLLRDGHMILGDDGGLHITYDDGKTYFKANTPAVGQFYSVNVDMEKPYNIYGGLQDNGVWYGPSTYIPNMEWNNSGQYPYKFILGGDGMQVQVDTRDNKTVYAGSQFGSYYRIDKSTGDQVLIQPKHKLGERPLRFNWQTPIWLSRHNQDIIYMGSNKFHSAMNKGSDFKTLTGDLTRGGKKGDVPYGTITAIHESPLKFGLLYIGTDDGLIYVSQDDGYNWKKISESLPSGGSPSLTASLWVSRVTASSFDTATVYASLSGYRWDDFAPYLYVSKNYGQSWQKIGTDLPSEPINVVKEDPKNKNIIYVGTDNGLYVSLNKGKSFMSMTDSLPSAPVHDLVIHPRDNDLVVGTHGRSLYIAHVEELQQLTDSVLAKELFVFKPKPFNYNADLGKISAQWRLPAEMKKEFSFYVKEKGISTLRIKIILKDSLAEKEITLKEIKDTSEAGLNYVSYDFSMDSLVLKQYQTWVNKNKKPDYDGSTSVTIERADDKKYYLKPGKYFLEVETQNGTKAKEEFILKSKEKENRSQAEPENEINLFHN
jgi:photosystem II stability/assembly factor-like uncharacterized protein